MNFNLRIFNIFRKGSKTYFYSSLFFPGRVRDDVFLLYAFVRVADDFVDSVPQQIQLFEEFENKFRLAWKGERQEVEVIDGFVEMAKRNNFELSWVEAFLRAMKSDTRKSVYKTMSELEEYIYGSAEVIGLMMARIMKLPQEALKTAKALGKAMQYVNFIRDIEEDNQLGRTYFPVSELKKFKLSGVTKEIAFEEKENFEKFVRAQINTYWEWEKESEGGFKYLPRRYAIPIKTAASMYRWTAEVIHTSPLIVFERKVKPSVVGILCEIGKQIFS